MRRRVSVIESKMTIKNWSFDRKLFVTFVVVVTTACGGFAAADNHEGRQVAAQRVAAAPTSSGIVR